MQPVTRSLADAWADWAVPGVVIQIKGDSVLFRPRASTRPFWLYLGSACDRTPGIGACALVIHPVIFNCQRLVGRRGQMPRVPHLEYRSDELERCRGRLVSKSPHSDSFVLDLGFPVVVGLLQECEDFDRAEEGDVLEMEFAPPTQAYPLEGEAS